MLDDTFVGLGLGVVAFPAALWWVTRVAPGPLLVRLLLAAALARLVLGAYSTGVFVWHLEDAVAGPEEVEAGGEVAGAISDVVFEAGVLAGLALLARALPRDR